MKKLEKIATSCLDAIDDLTPSKPINEYLIGITSQSVTRRQSFAGAKFHGYVSLAEGLTYQEALEVRRLVEVGIPLRSKAARSKHLARTFRPGAKSALHEHKVHSVILAWARLS